MKKASLGSPRLIDLVRMERLELSRLSALTPQASVSTNSTTSASSIDRWNLLQLPAGCLAGGDCCGGTAGWEPVAGVAGVAAGGAAGSAGNAVGSAAGAGAGADCCTVSTTLVGAFCWLNRYVRPRLVRKNSVARTAVVRERELAEPRAPNTVPDAPAPKPAPASAPLPRCRSTIPMIANRAARGKRQPESAANSSRKTLCQRVRSLRRQPAPAQMRANSSALSDTPPTSPPSISGIANSSWALEALTLPPYRSLTDPPI